LNALVVLPQNYQNKMKFIAIKQFLSLFSFKGRERARKG